MLPFFLASLVRAFELSPWAGDGLEFGEAMKETGFDELLVRTILISLFCCFIPEREKLEPLVFFLLPLPSAFVDDSVIFFALFN